LNALLQDLATTRDWLRYAVSRFRAAKLHFGHGTDNAYDEAVYLILHTLHLPLDTLEPFLDARLTHSERGQVLDCVERRVNDRVPAAYLTHEAWLGEFRFFVDERVLIPRSYIAELLRDGLSPWIDDVNEVRTALDLCTGSGCLAILLAHYFPQADIDAADISSDALAVAQRNVAEYDLQGRINLIRSDLFANLTEKTYKLIISNPPYVNAIAMEALPAEYLHEPRLALTGGEDGLDAVRVIIDEAREHLEPGGVLIVEVGSGRGTVETAFPMLELTWLVTEGSDDSVFLLTREQLQRASA
jgi:ribosomal protein L3 glutamine methyltransferase